VPNTSGSGGETWFFYGSDATSRTGGGASTAEQTDFNNICNWYSNKTTEPSDTFGLATELDKRATAFPNSNSIIHFYSPVDAATFPSGGLTVKTAYFWRVPFRGTITGTNATLGPGSCAVVIWEVGVFANLGTINGGGMFISSRNDTSGSLVGTVNGGAVFLLSGRNTGIVNGGAIFKSINFTCGNFTGGVVNGGAEFFLNTQNGGGTVNGGADFYGNSKNDDDPSSPFTVGVVNDGAVFFDTSSNDATVSDGAEFYDSSQNLVNGTVNGGAVFNDLACSRRFTGSVGPPCTKVFVAHPTDLPTCNGTATSACADPSAFCGCG
jgi:hypothetical protein